MKVLFIGGTGLISSACSELALERGIDLYILNRSQSAKYPLPAGAKLLMGDVHGDEPGLARLLAGHEFEAILLRAYREQAFPVTIVRPSLTYGPSQIALCGGSWQHPYTVIERMKRGRQVIVPGDGTSLWVLTWNGDFAKGFLGLLGNPKAIGEAYHITSDEVLTWNQIYSEVGRALGVELQIVHVPSDLIAAYDPEAVGSLIGDKANSVVFDNSKIKQLVPDFQCTVPWSEGVRRALAWFDEDASRRSIDERLNHIWDRILLEYQKAFP
jgi:nucleoside-diphosphate-sugar epimerase